MLGYRGIQTTQIYTHMVGIQERGVTNPLYVSDYILGTSNLSETKKGFE